MKKAALFLLVCLCGLLAVATQCFATTYVFGEDGLSQDLTSSLAGNSWTSSDDFIIAGDCYVDDDDTLTIGAGVTVAFDYDYDGDTGTPTYPTIVVRGTIICNGTENY